MAAPQQGHPPETPAEESGVQLRTERRVPTRLLDDMIAERDRMLDVVTRYSRGELAQAELPPDAHTYPGQIVQANDCINDLRMSPTEQQWTLQQYATNQAGEPWFVLQKEDESGQLRTVSGSREQLDKVIAEHGLKPLELPPLTVGTHYREAIGSVEVSPEIRREETLGVSG